MVSYRLTGALQCQSKRDLPGWTNSTLYWVPTKALTLLAPALAHGRHRFEARKHSVMTWGTMPRKMGQRAPPKPNAGRNANWRNDRIERRTIKNLDDRRRRHVALSSRPNGGIVVLATQRNQSSIFFLATLAVRLCVYGLTLDQGPTPQPAD